MKSKTIVQYVNQFGVHVGNAITSIENAAKLYSEAVRIYGEKGQSAFESQYPHVTPNTWAKFRMVGEGDLNPAAMLLSDGFCMKLARMPRHKQDAVLNGDSIEVFNPTTRKVDRLGYSEIKPRHEKIIFDDHNSCVRTIAQQVAYTDMIKAQKMEARRNYTVNSDHLEVHCACIIGKNELEGILEEME